ncbi:MAG: L-seryl-tRNA(Sec) selenium transferase [Nitrospiraceae bacterium]|nr:MAG: L-seryl-tRNA(Sec) selenium transferase [Nitrospiraceae bacterium]
MTIQQQLAQLPSVDECLKSSYGKKWLASYARKTVLRAIREVIDSKRKEILNGAAPDISIDAISRCIETAVKKHSAYKLRPLINATGVVIHTNLGRSILSAVAIEHMMVTAGSYSNLEYDLSTGKRGRRYSNIRDIIKELTGAEDAVVVNNNAAAVLICLDTFAKGREVIVSRGELVEIGGSFRIPEVMKASGAILREVGTTNKTHFADYENALCGNTALLLKVHQSNYRVIGFTEEVPVEKLMKLGREYGIPVMDDLGSGCMIDLKKYGVPGEPTVQEVVRTGADVVTFSGDKLLGGPQAGIIVGKEKLIQKIQKNPLLRAMRIDKMTLASLEATFMQYLDEEKALREIPALRMMTEPVEIIRKRAKKIYALLKKDISGAAQTEVVPDQSQAGGGSLPEINFPTFAVSVKPDNISVNELEKRLRLGDIPVIARIKGNALLIDARTVQDGEVKDLVRCVSTALGLSRDDGTISNIKIINAKN